MPALTREERETVFLVNDLGEITIHSTSPSWKLRLRRRLGPPTSTTGECYHWEGLTTDTTTIRLPGKRRKPKTAAPSVERQRQDAASRGGTTS